MHNDMQPSGQRHCAHVCSTVINRANYNSLTSDICQVNISECQVKFCWCLSLLYWVRPCKVEISVDRHNVSPAADGYNLPADSTYEGSGHGCSRNAMFGQLDTPITQILVGHYKVCYANKKVHVQWQLWILKIKKNHWLAHSLTGIMSVQFSSEWRLEIAQTNTTTKINGQKMSQKSDSYFKLGGGGGGGGGGTMCVSHVWDTLCTYIKEVKHCLLCQYTHCDNSCDTTCIHTYTGTC